MGSLQRNKTGAVTAIPFHLFAGYEFHSFNISGYFQHVDVTMKESKDKYAGIYSNLGVGVGFSPIFNKRWQLSFHVQKAFFSSMTLVTQSEGEVNGLNYKTSSLINLKGNNALQILAGAEWLGIGRSHFSGDDKFYYGVHLAYLSETFSSQTTRIKTNNSELAPVSPGEEEVSYSFSLISLLVSLNYHL